ncbi:MAG TPA: hypothetical protein DDZ81_14710 [Acetobacteraceae bacterium]|jgi:hypothetical protein|nr:hypothetical protein [Acetobacteraceae bacterium]
MLARSILLWLFLGLTAAVCLTGRAVAELITALFPDGVPGYDAADGVTVETRLHPEQMPLGLREGAFEFSPRLDEAVGYTSNALPGPYRRGSWELTREPALAIESGWSRDSLGARFSVQDTSYLDLPSQNRTDAALMLGGRIDIGDDRLTLAAAHLSEHEDRGALGTIASDRPIAFQIDDLRASYAMADGRWTIEPSVQATTWTYGDTTVLGLPASEAFRDRVVLQEGITARYELAPLRDILLVVRGVQQDYTRTPPNQARLDSTSYQVLAGLDYDDDAVWRWRMLVGGEARRFASPQYQPENTFIAEGSAAWSPTGLTTVTATITRQTGDAEQSGASGLIYSAARLTIDHEYLRDLLFRASFGLQRADFFQGGYQVGTAAGLGVTWMLNRHARLSFTYDQTDIHASASSAGTFGGGYSQGVALLTMRLGL